MSETFICKVCGHEKPRREGRVYDEWRGDCRACRERKRKRESARCARETQKIHREAMRGVVERLSEASAEIRRTERKLAHLTKHQAEAEERFIQKMIKSNFLKATAITRRRIREMEAIENPSAKTQRALLKRREILDRYEAAYALQRAMARDGVRITHIQDLIQE